MNSIEALWSVVKGDIKNRLLERREIKLSQADLKTVIRASLNSVQPEQQQRAARLNNRHFMHQVLRDLADPRSQVTLSEMGQVVHEYLKEQRVVN